MNQSYPGLMILFLSSVPLLGVPVGAQDKPGKKNEKSMLECRVILKEKTTDPRFANEVALLEVELKNVSAKAIDIVYTSAPAIFQYMKREDRIPDGKMVKSNCIDNSSPHTRSILTLSPGQAIKGHFGTIGGVGPGIYRIQATFEYEKIKAVSPVLEVELRPLKKK